MRKYFKGAILVLAMSSCLAITAHAKDKDSTEIGLENGGTPSTAVYKKKKNTKPNPDCIVYDPMGSASFKSVPGTACDGNDIVWWGSTYFSQIDGWQEDPQLPKVIVTATKRLTDWVTVCVGDACSDFLANLTRPRGGPHSWPVEKYVEANDIREHKEDACSRVAEISEDGSKKLVANTTSKHPPEDRLLAAQEILRDSISFKRAQRTVATPWGALAYAANNGFELEVTFSDGGKETYFFRMTPEGEGGIPSNDTPKREGSLVEGDGQSKCPK